MAGDLHKPLIELLEDERKSGYEAGKKAGIREVVEWIKEHYAGGKKYDASYYAIEDTDLENQLEKWGI